MEGVGKEEGKREKGKGQRAGRLAVTVMLFAAFLPAGPAAEQSSPPLLTAPVNDFANIIDAASEQELERRIRALQQATGDVVVVATVDTFAPYASIEEFAVRMFENGGTGIGEKGLDNGALVVLALQEREVRIEVGYDLEEFITDGYAGETIRLMVPEFRTGGYGRGLLAGTTRLINRIAERRNVALQDVPSARQPVQPPEFNVWPIIFLIWMLVIMASSRRRRRRRRRWGAGSWSGWNSGVGPFGGGGFGTGGFGGGFGGFGGGGGGGGGFGGFGGGRSGGGGASGRW